MVVPVVQLGAAFIAICTLYEATPLPASVAAVQLSCTCALPAVALSVEPSGALLSSVIEACNAVLLPLRSRSVTLTTFAPSPELSAQALVAVSGVHDVHCEVFEMHMLMGGPASIPVTANVTADLFVAVAPALIV